MKAALLAIGDELVSGLTVDTNSGFLAQMLRGAGIEVVSVATVPDDEEAILRALQRALEDAPIVVTTGGLGPTSDDLTTACVARLASTTLELDKDSLAHIKARFATRGLEMPLNNAKQAYFPDGSTILPNPEGTAPGFLTELGGLREDGVVACLPGVPREMRRIATDSLVPILARRATGRHLSARIFSTVGLSESRLDELLTGALERPGVRVSYRAAFPRLQVRLTVSKDSAAAAETELDALEVVVREKLGSHLYAIGDVGLEEAVGDSLLRLGLTLAVAESCTGGLIGHRITEVPGSSRYFAGGIVAYSNELKRSALGVREITLAEYGAVSEPVALEMAKGVAQSTRADIGVATTGIAGPDGGSPEKPVGTVVIAITHGQVEWVRTYSFESRSRTWIKQITAQTALYRILRFLQTAR